MRKRLIALLMTGCLATASVSVMAEETDYSYLEDMSVKELRALDAAIHDLLGDALESVEEEVTEAPAKLEYVDLLGIWSSMYEYEGNNFNVSIEFMDDGTYSKVAYKNSALSSEDTGIYEIEGGDLVILYSSRSLVPKGISTEYEYIDGNLVNNEHVHSKKR